MEKMIVGWGHHILDLLRCLEATRNLDNSCRCSLRLTSITLTRDRRAVAVYKDGSVIVHVPPDSGGSSSLSVLVFET